MKQLIVFISLVIAVSSFWSCKKDKSDNESIFYGMWSKGTNAGDTLFFFQRDGRNIMAYNLSFNSALPASTESDYSYGNGKLNIRPHGSRGSYFLIQSFTWKRYGQEFELQGIELYPFMSSTQMYFSFHKIQ